MHLFVSEVQLEHFSKKKKKQVLEDKTTAKCLTDPELLFTLFVIVHAADTTADCQYYKVSTAVGSCFGCFVHELFL